MLLEFQWSSLAHESDVAELLQRIGIDIATVVLRRKRYTASRAECFDYKCKEHHTCGCRYALTVTKFGGLRRESIPFDEMPVTRMKTGTNHRLVA